MNRMPLIVFVLVLAIISLFPSTFAQAQTPGCSTINGTAAVTYTLDEGQTLTPSNEQLQGIGYTYGLVALDRPHTLLATHQSNIIISEDAGCNWRVLQSIDSETLILNAAKGGFAYGWEINSNLLLKVELNGTTRIKQPVDAIIGLGVDSQNGNHLRISGSDGTIWDSPDGGTNWQLVSKLKTTDANGNNLILYKTVFEESNLDHILTGTTLEGAFFTKNGGKKWKQAKGFAPAKAKANVFTFVISPVNPKVVWAMGINLAESGTDNPSRGKHIYRSTNGGKSFQVVVDASPTVNLVNGPVMAAHPTKENILYFVFGTFFQDFGTDIYKYDANSKRLTTTHNNNDDISSITFSPENPDVMYLGLDHERE